MATLEHTWSSVLEIIKQNITSTSFNTWFEPLRIKAIDDEVNIVYLEVQPGRGNEFIIKTIKDRYLPYLKDAFKQVLKKDYSVVIKESFEYSEEEAEAQTVSDKKEKKPTKKDVERMEKLFNPKYTFENFVVGVSNKYAHAAAVAVAESPSEAYNPLFIYGGSGLGKTHLMHAIGIYLLKKNPKLNILYVSAEMFTNEVIAHMTNKTMDDFKNKYRKLDVLLLDDVQFLEGKDRSVEEFFNTFQALYSMNSQIIVSSDRPPQMLLKLDERLRSRLAMNLIADITPPDYETRVAILSKKAENANLQMTDSIYEVICFIAEKFEDNIRELEGAFNRVVAFSKLLNEPIDITFAKRTLKDSIDETVSITPEKIKKIVAKKYNIKISDLESQKRTNNLAYPRQIAMYMIREMTDLSLPKIGEYFGGRHYTTVMYACEKIEHDIKADSNFKKIIRSLEDEIKE